MAGSQVSWQQPYFAAKVEDDGHGDTCGPIVMLDYLAVVQGLPLTVAQIDSMRAQFIAAGLMNTPAYRGMTMTSLDQAFAKFYSVRSLKVVPWGKVNFDTFHADLKAAMLARQYVVIETSNAAALPGNQQGVANHFIGAWGIQSSTGYYCANGDTLLALAKGGVVGPVWYDIGDLAACKPGAYGIYPAAPVTPDPHIADAIAHLGAALADLKAA